MTRLPDTPHGLNALFRSGEATIAVLEWWRDGRAAFNAKQGQRKSEGSDSDEEDAARRSPSQQARRIPPIGTELPVPCILAADPVRIACPFDMTSVLQYASTPHKHSTPGQHSMRIRSPSKT